jgi:alpha-beta hydrolase superfamily lysophospholipase
MSWTGKNKSLDGMMQREFTLTVDGHDVPGVCWEPDGGADRLVLLGHGGTTHKKTGYIVLVAGLLAERGIASMAIDGPGHGDRLDPEIKPGPGAFDEMWNGGGGQDTMLADWRAALDFLESEAGPRPTGWWGLSMGTMMGLPVTATDYRIKVALLGLMGSWGPSGDQLLELAPKVTCPVRFLVQWDDEIVPRDACLELFTALGTKKKTLHGNPGAHQAVPAGEINGSVDYLNRYLK